MHAQQINTNKARVAVMIQHRAGPLSGNAPRRDPHGVHRKSENLSGGFLSILKMIGLFYACLQKASFLQVSLDFVSVVIFAAALSSYADIIQLRSERESWRILLRIRQSPELFSLPTENSGAQGFAVSFLAGSDLIH